jgi:hypothetical protein
MSTAGVGPQPTTVVFPDIATLKQDLSRRVSQHDRDGQVCNPESMRFHLLHRPEVAILGVDGDHMFK